jgi:hypothetical protein
MVDIVFPFRKMSTKADQSHLVFDHAALQMVLCVLTGRLDRREQQAIAYLVEENRSVLSQNSAEHFAAPFQGFCG